MVEGRETEGERAMETWGSGEARGVPSWWGDMREASGEVRSKVSSIREGVASVEVEKGKGKRFEGFERKASRSVRR